MESAELPTNIKLDEKNVIDTYVHIHAHTIEYWSTITKNEMQFSGKWMELKIRISSKISQSQKTSCETVSRVFSHLWNIGGEKNIKVKGRL
jgi:hypothetical protein